MSICASSSRSMFKGSIGSSLTMTTTSSTRGATLPLLRSAAGSVGGAFWVVLEPEAIGVFLRYVCEMQEYSFVIKRQSY